MIGTSVLKMELVRGAAREEDTAWRQMVEAKRELDKAKEDFDRMEEAWVEAKYHEKYIQSCIRELGW